MTIALICAMPMELAPLTKKLDLQKETRGGVKMRVGKIGDQNVVAIHTGMGPELAHDSTEALLSAVDNITRVVVFGITGAVHDHTEIGELIVPEKVVNALTGSEHTPTPHGATPKGVMWTTNVITPAHELPPLIERGVVSLDMETAVIGACCDRRNIPWSVRRAISDRATDGSVTEEVFKMANMDGTPNPKRVAAFFLKHPNKVPAMMRMAKGGKRATEVAADAAIAAAKYSPT
ncbi:MAG: adenosylhomocysteine nucleosidase [Actinomycetota bacterium]